MLPCGCSYPGRSRQPCLATNSSRFCVEGLETAFDLIREATFY